MVQVTTEKLQNPEALFDELQRWAETNPYVIHCEGYKLRDTLKHISETVPMLQSLIEAYDETAERLSLPPLNETTFRELLRFRTSGNDLWRRHTPPLEANGLTIPLDNVQQPNTHDLDAAIDRCKGLQYTHCFSIVDGKLVANEGIERTLLTHFVVATTDAEKEAADDARAFFEADREFREKYGIKSNRVFHTELTSFRNLYQFAKQQGSGMPIR